MNMWLPCIHTVGQETSRKISRKFATNLLYKTNAGTGHRLLCSVQHISSWWIQESWFLNFAGRWKQTQFL